MNLNINGIDVAVGEAAVAEAVRRQLLGTPQKNAGRFTVPRIGAAFENGVFAGIARGIEGAPDYGLIAGPESPQKHDWKGAFEFADEHKAGGWRIFLPHESALCYATIPDQFKKDGWYWTAKQCEGGADFAWAQDFGYGYQGNYHKDDKFWVRLVRSVFVIE